MTDQRKPTGAYSVAMLAERWGTSNTFVYDQIKGGKLRAFKLGNKLIRVRPEDVQAYEDGAILDVPEIAAAVSHIAREVARLVRVAATR